MPPSCRLVASRACPPTAPPQQPGWSALSNTFVTASALVGQDNEVAYGSLYDAARKAVTAHMLANGLRAPAKPGAHESVGVYAAERVPDLTGSVREFQRLRRRRNKSEYDDITFGRREVEADLLLASNIVSAVRSSL